MNTPFEQTILAGLKRCITSSACQTAFGAVVVGAVTLYFSLPSLTSPATKSAAIIGFLGLIGVLARDIISGFAAENVASIHAEQSAASDRLYAQAQTDKSKGTNL